MLQRAIQTEDKERRRNDILDAAETLWMADPEHELRIEDVARAAGVAKGTVYLYFRSKEEMLLAIHIRHVEAFFHVLLAACTRGRLTFDDMMDVVRTHMVRVPAFLPITSLCTGLMESGVSVEAALEFKRHIAGLLSQAGAALQVHFNLPSVERAVALLMHSYALITGLWQVLRPSRLHALAHGDPNLGLMHIDYETELDIALRALWVGELGMKEIAS